jgi:hypothetical protein
VRAYDAKGAQTAAWGKRGSQAGELLDPRGIAVAPNGQVLVADSGNDRVQAFTALGEPVLAFGRRGSGPGELNDPRGIAVDAERIAVADARNDRVQVFDRKGAPLLQIGGRGSGEGRFRAPLRRRLRTRRTPVRRRQRQRARAGLRPRRTLRARFRRLRPLPGQFSAPCGLDFAAGRLYVADRDNHRVQVFDPTARCCTSGVCTRSCRARARASCTIPTRSPSPRTARPPWCARASRDRAQAFGALAPLAPEDQPPPQERVTTAHFGPGVAASGN